MSDPHYSQDDAQPIPVRRPAPPQSATRSSVDPTAVMPVRHNPPAPAAPPPQVKARRPVDRPVSAPPARRRRWRRLLLPVIAWLAFTLAAPLHAWWTTPRIDDLPAGQRPASGAGTNYLLVGSDSRGDLSAADRKRLGTGNAEGQRTDSIMVVHTPGITGGQRVVVSIPRDSYVNIPGHGKDKINAAFAIGGADLLVETIESATGLRIDGYLEIGFGGFANVVDALGGVRICVPFDMNDSKAHINLKKGCQTLDGPNALGYVRARYSDPRGDLGRADRQRQFLGAIMAKAATPATILVPWRWWSFTHAAAAGMAVGEDTSSVDLIKILLAMRGLGGGSTASMLVPIATDNLSTPSGSAVAWDTDKANALWAALRDGQDVTAPAS